MITSLWIHAAGFCWEYKKPVYSHQNDLLKYMSNHVTPPCKCLQSFLSHSEWKPETTLAYKALHDLTFTASWVSSLISLALLILLQSQCPFPISSNMANISPNTGFLRAIPCAWNISLHISMLRTSFRALFRCLLLIDSFPDYPSKIEAYTQQFKFPFRALFFSLGLMTL